MKTHHRLLRNQPIPNPTPPVALISRNSSRAHPCRLRPVRHPGDEPFVALGRVGPVFEACMHIVVDRRMRREELNAS